MNCSPTIAIALLLLSLTAGMWLLYKTQKENLNGFFKFVAWLVIVASFIAMICCACCCAMRCCMKKQECREMQMRECGMGYGGMNKCKDDDACDPDSYREKKGCCKEEKEGCEESKEECKEMKVEKDSVVVKENK